MIRAVAALVALALSGVNAHYLFPSLIIGEEVSTPWQYVRRTDNYQTNAPVQSVGSPQLRCYTSSRGGNVQTATVAAGTQIGIQSNNSTAPHSGVSLSLVQSWFATSLTNQQPLNIYMAKAPAGTDVANWDGAGQVWFKVYQIGPILGKGTMTWPATGVGSYKFNLPKSLPTGQYLMRTEHIGLHQAQGAGGAQFFLSCAQLNVIDGGNGKPGPLVSIPGVYNGNEPGIRINIYYPVPTTYVQPGPPVWGDSA